MSDELSVTPASQWGVQTVTVRLPSGHVAELRKKFPAFMLMQTGQLDSDALASMEKMLQGGLDDPGQAVKLTQLILGAMFVNPRFGDGGVTLDVLDDDDVGFVLDRALGGAPDPSFQDQPDGSGGGGGSEAVGDTTERASGDGTGKRRQPAARPRSRGKAAGAREK